MMLDLIGRWTCDVLGLKRETVVTGTWKKREAEGAVLDLTQQRQQQVAEVQNAPAEALTQAEGEEVAVAELAATEPAAELAAAEPEAELAAAELAAELAAAELAAELAATELAWLRFGPTQAWKLEWAEGPPSHPQQHRGFPPHLQPALVAVATKTKTALSQGYRYFPQQLHRRLNPTNFQSHLRRQE
jgi:hypothetical protein